VVHRREVVPELMACENEKERNGVGEPEGEVGEVERILVQPLDARDRGREESGAEKEQGDRGMVQPEMPGSLPDKCISLTPRPEESFPLIEVLLQ